MAKSNVTTLRGSKYDGKRTFANDLNGGTSIVSVDGVSGGVLYLDEAGSAPTTGRDFLHMRDSQFFTVHDKGGDTNYTLVENSTGVKYHGTRVDETMMRIIDSYDVSATMSAKGPNNLYIGGSTGVLVDLGTDVNNVVIDLQTHLGGYPDMSFLHKGYHQVATINGRGTGEDLIEIRASEEGALESRHDVIDLPYFNGNRDGDEINFTGFDDVMVMADGRTIIGVKMNEGTGAISVTEVRGGQAGFDARQIGGLGMKGGGMFGDSNGGAGDGGGNFG